MADGDVPLVKSFSADVEFATNGKTKANSRMSNLLFWQGRGKGGSPSSPRNWIHSADALVKGHVAYLVKFLGCTQVDQPKGIEVVKDAIKKLQFTEQLKKSETKTGSKCRKVEITISVDGVAIQEPRSNNIMYQFPLHRISYCADDKGAKKYFSFIAKGGSTVNGGMNGEDESEKHECFVFISTKLASEITLTIGQAFDLAYRRFLNDNGKYIEMQKLTLQNKKLELQMSTYKNRLQELSKLTYKDDLDAYLGRKGLANITEFKTPAELEKQITSLTLANSNGFSVNGNKTPELAQDAMSNNSTDTFNSNDHNLLLATPPPTHNGNFGSSKFSGDSSSSKKQTVVGTKLENLIFPSDDDSDFDPRAFESDSVPAPFHAADTAVSPPPPILAPPPKTSKRTPPQAAPAPAPLNGSDLFGAPPFTPPAPAPAPRTSQYGPPKPNYDISDFNLQTSVFNTSTSFTNGLSGFDPFESKGNNIFGNGYGNTFNGFGSLSDKQTVELNSSFNGFLDKTINEMKDGFSRGISFGNDDFSIENDPFKKN